MPIRNRENPPLHATTTTRVARPRMAMQSAVKEALASAIARGVNPRGVHRARTIGASVRARRTVCAAADAEGGAAESPSEDARTVPARPPPLRTYYADWAEVMLPDGHRFPMEKYQATRMVLEEDKSLTDIMELVPSPVSNIRIPFPAGTATCATLCTSTAISAPNTPNDPLDASQHADPHRRPPKHHRSNRKRASSTSSPCTKRATSRESSGAR